MSSKKANKIGYDPLAWMNADNAPKNDPVAPPVQPINSKPDPVEQDNPLGLDVGLLEQSFALLAPQGAQLVERFYEELFYRHPEVRPLFEGIDASAQQQKLLSALVLVVDNLRKPDALVPVLQELGVRHQGYGVNADQYGAVAETLLAVMAEFAGQAWTTEIQAAWEQALEVVAGTMLGAYQMETKDMATSKQAMNSAFGGSGTIMEDLEALKDILEHVPMNIMMADNDENIIFINKKALDVLTEVEHELARYLPGFRAADVVGGSIHRYHKDPGAIANILHGLRPGDKRKGFITPGPFFFEHETRALFNRAGARIGYVVQWADVTEQRAKSEQAERLQKAVDGSQTAFMMIDRDLIVTYANTETVQLLSRYEDTLRKLYPSFSSDKLIGSCIDMFHKNPAYQRRLLDDPRNLPHEADIHVGPLTFHIRVSAIHNLDGSYIGNTLEWSDVTELRRSELEVARLKSAIDGAQTNLMLCDENLDIAYINPAVHTMLLRRAAKLAETLPGFDPNNLIGQNIDQFHKNKAHQRALLADKSRLPYKTEIKVADLEFGLNATYIEGPNGEYMGNMVQWSDITEQKDAERQIQDMIVAAAAGNLDKRIDTSRYDGFLKGLGDGINRMIDAMAQPLTSSIDVMKALSEGNLTKKMDGDYQGDFLVMRDAVNASIENLYDMVSKIRQSAETISTGAGEISDGNTNLSQRTEEQASSLEETASSMEQLTSTVKQNADNARQANQLSTAAQQTAIKGGEVVGRAVSAMGEINSASKKISDIIGVIDEIAFQTNLLALNAAVEAARAGEQGRGFAVVAGEVRNLAQRSATAAKEIKGLINESVERVNEGSALVDESGSTLDEIVNSVKKVSDIISEIAAASAEQSSGIEQVNKAVMQMDEMTQQNAALVEEAAAASKSMDEQAHSMRELVGFFDIGEVSSAPDSRRQRSVKPASVQPTSRAAEPAARRNPKSRQSAPLADDSDWEEF